MTHRDRSTLEAELGHVHFLLDELKRWETADVPASAQRFLHARYERQARILMSVLTEMPVLAEPPAVGARTAADARVGGASPMEARNVVSDAGAAASVKAPTVVAPLSAAAGNAAEVAPSVAASAAVGSDAEASKMALNVAAVDGGAGASVDVRSLAPETWNIPDDVALPLPASTGEAAVALGRVTVSVDEAEAAMRSETGATSAASEPSSREDEGSIPENPAEPFAAPPEPRPSLADRLVGESSAWNRVWRPFLYESIMWFVGAFLILSGTLYFVFESWDGMSSVTRSLTVFGMTAGYSAGFSIWGAFMGRREALRNPGRILGLIGSAVAPLAGVALGPIGFGEALHLGGVGPALLVPLLVAWAAFSAVLARKPAEAYDASSAVFVQVGLAASTLMMGLAPVVAKLGSLALWLDLLPCALFFLLARRPTPEPRQPSALGFAIAAPLYLLALYAVRLHVALAGAGVPPSFGTYAPFVAFLLATCLRFRTLPAERGADSLSVSVVSLQAACLFTATTGTAPAFFLTAAILTWTQVSLARGAVARLPWVYPAYFSAYLAYASSAQLVPGAVTRLIDALKARLGYTVSESLPLQFGALTALPFILAGVVFAASRLWRGQRTGDARDAGLAEVLLRSTAVASPLFVLYGMAGPDARPSFWSALCLAVVCIAAGLLLERFYLTAVGAVLALLLPFLGLQLLGAVASALVTGGVALALAGVSTLCTRRTRHLFGVVVGVMSFVGFCEAFVGYDQPLAVLAVVLCGLAALVVAWTLPSALAVAGASLLLAAAVPHAAGLVAAHAVAPAFVAVALGLALLGERGGRLRMLGLPALLYASLALPVGTLQQMAWLGPVLLVGAAAVAVASRTFKQMRFIAVILGAIALLPDVTSHDAFLPWNGWMKPGMSLALLVLLGLGASVATARWGRSASTVVAGLLALVFPLMPVALAGSSSYVPMLLGAAFAALFTVRALHPLVSIPVAALYAGAGLFGVGPEALLGLAAVLSVLAVLEEVSVVRRVATGGQAFASVATAAAMVVLGISVARWDQGGPVLLLAGSVTLPLLWTRANRQPILAGLMVPYSVVGAGMAGIPAEWIAGVAVVALAVVRLVAHVPAAASGLLRSREEAPRQMLSWNMQGWLVLAGLLMLVAPSAGNLSVYVIAASLALMTGAKPSLRVCAAAFLLMFIPQARPYVTGLLLALALVEHHAPKVLWTLFHAPPDAVLRLASVCTALLIAALPVMDHPEPAVFAGLAGVLFISAFLLSQRWLLTPAIWVLALAPLARTDTHAALQWRPETGHLVLDIVLGAALLSAACQVGGGQRALDAIASRLTPGLNGTWSEPLWAGAAGTLAVLLVGRLMDVGPGALSVPLAVGAALASLILMVTRERWMAHVATALFALSLISVVPPLWTPAVLSGAGLLLCVLGHFLDAREVRVGSALHHGGWVLALLSLTGLRDLEHVGTPLCIAFGLGSAWTVVLRRREREMVGWLASLVAVHGWLMHLGAVYSSGRGEEFILPYFGAASALLAALALFVAGPKVRRLVGHGFTVVALTEVVMGLALVDGSVGALREAMVSCIGLTVLLFALVRRAAVEEDEASAFLAQGVVALGYLSLRMLGMGAHPSTADSLAALAGGALFTGLYLFVQREGSGLAVFRRPALVGAWLFPLAGLVSAPWDSPLHAAALMVGYAAHFAALATHPSRRGLASVTSVAAFNVALFLVWLGMGTGDAQFYVIPAGLSLIALLRVFRESLAEDTYARLRAVAVTAIYVAGAWKPLMFSDGNAMLLCVFLCVVGVGAGIALRIRSYVYLGTGFLVTCIAANLVRFGMRDHRVAAASLFLLGLVVIGSMVLLSAYRASLLQRFTRVRALLSTWEG